MISTPRIAAPALALLALTGPSPAHAEELVEVGLTAKAQLGQGQPELLVRARRPVAALRLDLERASDRRRVRAKAGPLRGGAHHVFPLALDRPGEARFVGTLEVVEGREVASMPIDVTVTLLEPLALTVDPGDVDLEGRTLRLRSSRPLERVQVTLQSDTGTPLGTTELAARPDDAGLVPVAWKQEGEGRVLRISLRGTDADGFYAGLDLHPWRVDIPHEDVVFATGSAIIEPGEAPKLAAAVEELRAALARYGAIAQGVSLFVAGHTDTVGDAPSNQLLSERRAQAIGVWFRKHGVRVPIRYAGFGESALLVQTPDDVDEARNRRAEYIVAVDPPRLSRTVRWQGL